MIDERQQELAALYAFGLLEGEELASFETVLAQSAELDALVKELREASTQLALSAPQVSPPAGLKQRIMERLPARAASRPTASVIRFPRSVIVPWAIAASLALGCAWVGQRYLAVRTENLALRNHQLLSAMEARGAQLQVEAERLIAKRDIADAQKAADELKTQLTDREKQLVALGQRIDALTGASAIASKLLVEAREQIATLNNKLQAQGDLAQFKIATLASMAGNSAQALAVAVWSPKTQEGVLSVAKLPALSDDKDYQLWLIDPAYPAPVDGGVFTVNPATGAARVTFKPNQRVNNAAKFAVSLERKGGVKKAEGPIVLIGD